MGDDVTKAFKQHKVVPDVLPLAPAEFLKVLYQPLSNKEIQQNSAFFLKVSYPDGVTVDKGAELTPTQVKTRPIVKWSGEADQFYTLALVDPDAPSRTAPQFREYQHWLVVNIPGSDIANGEELTAYVGSGPPQGTGLHRYVFLLFKQPHKLNCDEARIPTNSGSNRGKFSILKFAKKYKLGEALAGNFYQAQWDEYVPTVHRQLSGRG